MSPHKLKSYGELMNITEYATYQTRGVQRRMVLGVNFLLFLNYFFFSFVVAIFDNAPCGGYTWLMLTAISIWKSFLKYE